MTQKYNVKFQHKEDKWLTGPVRRRENGRSVPNGDIYTYEQAVNLLKKLNSGNDNLYNYTMEETA